MNDILANILAWIQDHQAGTIIGLIAGAILAYLKRDNIAAAIESKERKEGRMMEAAEPAEAEQPSWRTRIKDRIHDVRDRIHEGHDDLDQMQVIRQLLKLRAQFQDQPEAVAHINALIQISATLPSPPAPGPANNLV